MPLDLPPNNRAEYSPLPAPAGDPGEQAPAPRRRGAPRLAFLTIEGQDKGLPCSLRDYTREGAVVTVSGWIGIPERFSLYVEPEGVRHQCRISARKGSAVRVIFES